MIQIKSKVGSVAPAVLLNKGAATTETYKTQFNNGTVKFKFDSGIYGHKQVKEKLSTLQYGKCCFCESKFEHVGYGDVEHYRPKGGWIQNNEPLNQPGYYWLAYDWDNLLLSCQLCNQQYKKNYFPLETETDRARNHNDNIGKEDPLFLHAVNEDPENYIEFNFEIPKAINKNKKGKVTIEKLGLDRKALNEKRKATLNAIVMVYRLAKGHPKTIEQEDAKQFLINAQQDNTEYASMLRCFFRKNPIDF